MNIIKLVIFEDNMNFREMLYQVINGSHGFECVGAYADCTNILKIIEKTKPDVVMMDIGLPGINGIDAVLMLKEKFPELNILIETIFDDSEKIFAAICAGASGYILKSTPPSKILEYIIETHNGGAPLSPTVASKVLKMVSITENKSKKNSFNLTEREKEVIKYLMQGMSYKLIAETCCISTETIHFHIKNIYEKLHVHSRTEAVVKALKKNII